MCGTNIETVAFARRKDTKAVAHSTPVLGQPTSCLSQALTPAYVGRYLAARMLDTLALRREVKALGLRTTHNGSYRDRTALCYLYAKTGGGPAYATAPVVTPASAPSALPSHEVLALRRELARTQQMLTEQRAFTGAVSDKARALEQENARLCGECKALREQNDKLMGRSADPVEPLAVVTSRRFAALEVD